MRGAPLVLLAVTQLVQSHIKMSRRGFVQVYTGDGKGKTTAALGLAFRALGWGKRVLFVQFLKKGEFGEVKAAKEFSRLTIKQFGTGEFVDLENPPREVVDVSLGGWEFAKNEARKGDWDLLILDEINLLLSAGILPWSEVKKLLDAKPESLEVVFTGRGAPKQLLEKADLVTKFRKVKHPYDRGVKARKGLEY